MANAVELGVAYLSLVVESKGVPAQVQRLQVLLSRHRQQQADEPEQAKASQA